VTLTEALYFLDTNTRVQCPEISAQQARELAELLRSEHADLDKYRYLYSEAPEQDEVDHHRLRAEELTRESLSLRKERDEARAEVERLKQPVMHCSACNSLMHSTRNHPTSDVEVDASDYERPGKANP